MFHFLKGRRRASLMVDVEALAESIVAGNVVTIPARKVRCAKIIEAVEKAVRKKDAAFQLSVDYAYPNNQFYGLRFSESFISFIYTSKAKDSSYDGIKSDANKFDDEYRFDKKRDE